jgi:hypothetical protein
MSIADWDKNEIKRLAFVSGKPLEVECAEAFLKAGWQVRLGTFYNDILECADMTTLWFDATCRVVGKAVTCHRTPNEPRSFLCVLASLRLCVKNESRNSGSALNWPGTNSLKESSDACECLTKSFQMFLAPSLASSIQKSNSSFKCCVNSASFPDSHRTDIIGCGGFSLSPDG